MEGGAIATCLKGPPPLFLASKTVSLMLSDRMDGLRLNIGVHNYMTYITGDVPVGAAPRVSQFHACGCSRATRARDLACLCASASDAPCALERGAWLQPDQSVHGSKCVRRTGHRLDGKTATVDVGKRVTAEEHQVRVALVDPKRDLRSVVRISELHTSEAFFVPLEIGERMVEPVGRPRRSFSGCRGRSASAV